MDEQRIFIIGKPNVGKSTLFNRIIREKKSIVHNIAGVTRDFIYAKAKWDDVSFTLVDTCGIFEQPQNIIEEKQKEAIFNSLYEANLILFVVDGKNGLTSEDFHIVEYLRKIKVNVLLVANKCENFEKYVLEVKPELFSLGFGDPIAISAEHNKNIDELLDRVIAILKKDIRYSSNEDQENFDKLSEEKIIKVAIIGRPNVGKSSLFNSIIGLERAVVSEISGTTRDAIDQDVIINNHQFKFIDTAGMRKKSTITYGSIEMFSIARTLKAIEKSDVVVLVLDSTEGITHQDKSIIGVAENLGKSSVVVFNKWDLVINNQKKKEEFLKYFEKEFYFVNYSPIVFTSAPKKQGIEDLVQAIIVANESRNIKISNNLLNSVLERYVMISPPPVRKGKRIKFYYAAQVGVRPPVFVFYSNLPREIPKYYQQGLRNMIRKNINPFIGSPIFLKFEEKEQTKPSKEKIV